MATDATSSQVEQKQYEIVTIPDSDIKFIKEQHEEEGPTKILLGHFCTLLKQEKKKLNYLDRLLIITDLRIMLVKSKLTRKLENSYLLYDLTEATYREFDFGYIGLSLKFTYDNPNQSKKNAPPTISEEIIIASKERSQVLFWISRLMTAINALKQCVVYEPLIDIPSECGHSLDAIYDKRKLILAYQTLCCKNKVPVRLLLLGFLDDDAVYWNDFVDFYQLLKNTVDKKKNSKKGFIAHPIEISILLQSLHYVGNSFTSLHLDALPMTEDIVINIANLISVNQSFKILALRSTGLNPKLLKLLNDTLKQRNGDKRTTLLDGLVLSTNDFSDESSFLAIDPTNIQVKKLYLQDCKLTKESFNVLINHLLLSKEWNNKDNKYSLTKLDISDNFHKQDAFLTSLFSTWLKQVQCNLREFRMGNCGLSLNFIQDLASNKEFFQSHLKFLDLSGNELTPYCAGALKQILSETHSIELLTLSGMNLNGILINEFLSGIFKNSQCQMTIDLTKTGLNNNKFSDTLLNIINDSKKNNIDSKNAGLRGLILSKNELHSDLMEFSSIMSNLNQFNCIQRLILDQNFLYNKKKGYYAMIINNLVNSLQSMHSIETLSLRGNYDNTGKINNKTSYLLNYDDLIPLFEYVGGGSDNQVECNLKFLYIDGNNIGDKGCKMLGESLKFNTKLEILSCEDCKISLKGLKSLLAGVTGVDQSIYDILPLATLKLLKEDTGKKNWHKFTENELNNTLEVCRKNLEKMQSMKQEIRQRKKTEARRRRQTMDAASRSPSPPRGNSPPNSPPTGEGNDDNTDAANESKIDDAAAPADPNDTLAMGDDEDDDDSSSESLLDGYVSSGGIDRQTSKPTGKAQQTKVLRLARLMQAQGGGKIPISMGPRPSGLVKPFMGTASQRQRNVPSMAAAASADSNMSNGSNDDSKDDEKADSGGMSPLGSSNAGRSGMKVLDNDATQAKLDAPTGPQQKRKKRTRKKLDV